MSDSTNASGRALSAVAGRAKDALAQLVKYVPAPVKSAYTDAVEKAKKEYDGLSATEQRLVLIASAAGATLVVSHVLHSWWYRRTIRQLREGGHGAQRNDKNNASNTIYESEVSARQYMEFHYTPSKYTYVQKLRMLQESFDFPVRLVNKFRVYTPRSTPYLSAASASRRASASEGNTSPNKAGTAPHAQKKRALDIGCATGASVFEMSKYFDEVIGIDYSEVFIHLANEVREKSLKRPQGMVDKETASDGKSGGANYMLNVAENSADVNITTTATPAAKLEPWAIPYTAPVQGDNTERRELVLSSSVFPDRCQFYCGDAMNLFVPKSSNFSVKDKRSSLYKDVYFWKAPVLLGEEGDDTWLNQFKQGGEVTLTAADLMMEAERQAETENEEEKFDAVLCSNLIDRVPDPRKLLASFPLLVKKGGILVLCDPYSWWEGATDKREWIGGRNGVRSEDQVKQLLLSRFELLSESEEAFLIRDHIRHYQLGFSHCTIWRRR